MIPLSDGIAARRFPFVNVALIAANFAVWIFYELPHLGSSVFHASFYACTVDGACHGPEPWGVSWLTSIFMHGSWELFIDGERYRGELEPEAVSAALGRHPNGDGR